MKFLHAADIHLDSPLAGLARRDPALAELTATCTRRAFANLIDLAIAEDVAFLLIAGDLYDADWRDYGTGLFFAAEMRRLARPCIVIHGNHDAASQLTKSLALPGNVTVLPSRAPKTVTLAEHGVAIHGQSFPNRAVPEDLAANYPKPTPGLFNIGMLHSSVEDPGTHASYAPCRLETLVNKGYDYWALGHIHTRATLHDGPWVHFPGNPQGRHARETGSRGATLVEVAGGRVTLAHRATDVLRWEAVPVDAGGAEDMADLAARLRLALAAARLAAEARPLIARVTLHGATPLHARLLADPAGLEAECANAAAEAGEDLHIERVRLATTHPAEIAIDPDADLGPLEQAFRAALTPDQTDALLKDFAKLAAAIPAGAETALPSSAADLAALQDDAWHLVRHALTGSAAL